MITGTVRFSGQQRGEVVLMHLMTIHLSKDLHTSPSFIYNPQPLFQQHHCVFLKHTKNHIPFYLSFLSLFALLRVSF
ncbi:hypothetical protein L6452_21782 [Arctium lappa]|uniref:Uncharacterized protein n=1 Tax=Arctium lappa TaxID=4217 RepID=A0ACB9AY88_ARCLA|nr:hypothetical protein L6452_21782 [Arctium lappa]